MDGEQVPTEEKVYSIFETHTDLIKRGKARKPVEFGHKVFLAESAQGLITDYQVLEGNPADTVQVGPSLDRHQKTFQHAPELYAGDRGFHSAENQEKCEQAGVGHIGIPQRGGTKTAERQAFERSPQFKQSQRFLVGIEGRISVLIRGRGMSGQRARAVRGFGRSGGADQQPDADRRVVEGPETSPPGKARLSPAVLSPFLLTEAGSDPPVLADLRLSRRSPPGFRQRR